MEIMPRKQKFWLESHLAYLNNKRNIKEDFTNSALTETLTFHFSNENLSKIQSSIIKSKTYMWWGFFQSLRSFRRVGNSYISDKLPNSPDSLWNRGKIWRPLVRGSFQRRRKWAGHPGHLYENPFPHPKLLGAHMQMQAEHFISLTEC